MNKIFKVIWSKSKQCYIVVSEIAKNKTGKKKIVVAGIFAALSLIGHLQPVQAIDGAGDKAGFSNAASGVNFDSTKGIAIGLKNGDKTSANGNVATVAIGAHSNASGSSSVAIGGAVVDGAGAIGLGWSTAKGNNAVALGGTGLTNANGNNAFAASGGNANGESATAIGSSAIASGRGGVAVGWNSQSAVNAVGIGFNAKAKSNNTVAIGVEANSDNSIGDNSSSVSIGVKTRAREVGSMAMGVSADASGKYSIALGSGNVSGDYTATANYPKATGEKAIAIGYNSNSSNTGATAIGAGATASGTDSFAGGSGTAGGNSSIAIGKGASITAPIAGTTFGGQDSIAMGTGASAKQHSSVTIGVGSTSDGVRNITIGPKASASGVDSIAIGNGGVGGDKNNTGVGGNGNTYTIDVNGISTNVYYGVKSVDNGSIAFGNRANAAKGGLAIGTVSIADGGIAVGQSVLSKNGVAIGSAVSATAANAVAMGSTAEASSVGAVAIGGYSVTDKTKAQGNNALAIGASAVTNGNETIAIGKSANASNANVVAVGKNANASKANAVALGSDSTTDTNATRQANTTINSITYNFAGATSDTGMQVSVGAAGKERQIKNVAAGEVSATSTDAINGSQLFAVASQIKPQLKYVSIKSDTELDNANNDGATADKAIAIGPIAKASSKSAVAIGNTSTASSENAIAIGNNSNSSGVDSVAIGPSSVSNNVGSVAVGKDAKANGAFTVALGGGNWQNKGAQANGVGTIALGTYTRTKENTNYQTAVGFESKTDAESATAIGYQAVASGKDSVALGTGASTTGQDALTFGHNSQANGNSSLAMGLGAQANSNNAIALGYQTNSNSTNSTNGVFIGSVAGKETNGVGNIGIGSNTGNKIIGDNNVSIGTGAGSVTATNVYASESIMLGTQARAINSTSTSPINNVIAIGKGSSGGANSTIAIGQNASSTNQNSIAIGTNASAPAYNGVAIGSFSVANTEGSTVEGYNANASRTDKYAGLTGAVLKGNIGAVSIGSGGTMTRQIKNLAAGTADTDAVNVAQLKSVNLAFKGNTGTGDVNLAANPLTIKGNDSYITTNASGNTITISANQKDIHVISGTANADTGVANAKNVATAINDAISQNKYKWYLTADNDTAGSRATIDKEGTVKFSGDPNITVARSGNTITSSLNKIITVDTVKASKSVIAGSGNDQVTLDGTSGTVKGKTFSGQSFVAGNNVLSNTTLQIGSTTNGDNNVTISRDGFSSKAGTKTAKFGATGIDAGGQQITNVTSGGNVGTNAANITDVKNYVGKVALNIQSNSKTGTINLEQGALGVTGANGIRTDLGGTGNSNLIIGLDKNTVNATTNGIGLSSDSGTMLRKFLKDGNADFKISGDGGLVTTSGTTTGVQVSVDKSKVKDLAVEAVTVSKANTVDNPITVTPTTGSNSKEYAIGIDTTKLAAKTNLAYTANGGTAKTVSLAKGLNFVDGGSTVATVDNDGKVSFDLNTATKNQINTNITDIAANKGKIATNTTNIAANTTAIARNISLSADSGVRSSQSLSTGDVAFNVKGATGDYISTKMNGNTVEISTTRATINSDANTGAASVTGNDGLATAKNVADAINKAADAAKAGSTWNVSTNGDTSTKVSGGDTVDFTGDNNITVDRNNKTISTSLNKNLTDMNSISLVNPRGESIFLNGRDGSIKAGKAEFKDNVGAGSTITSDQLSFTNGATGANEATTTIALDAVSIQSGPNGSALTSKYLMFSDEDGNNAEGSAKGLAFQNAAGKSVQFTIDEINAGGNKIQEVAEGTDDTDAVNVKQLKDTVASQTLTYRANTAADADAKSVKLSKGLDFVDGTMTKATVDNDGKVTFDINDDTKTKINDSAAAVNRKVSLGADSGTASSQSLKDGDVAFNVKGATGDYVSTNMNGNTVEISTTRATINSDANTGAASVTGNDGLATAKNVADAINKAADAAKAGSTWNVSTNGDTSTKVSGGDTVDFTGDNNITVDRNNKTISTSLNKNLTDMNSISLGNPRGETIFLNGRDGSIKAGKAEFKDNVGAGSTITSDQLSFTNGATGANEATTTIALDTVSIQSGPNNSALTSKYLMFSDEDGNNAEGSAKGMGFQNAAGKTVQFSLDEIKAGGNKIQEVAEGTADTDAVNVKQLKDTVASQTLTYRANTAADADAKSVKLSKGLDFVDGTSTVATVDNDGKVSFDLNTATKTKIDDSATAVARKISLGADSGTVSSQSLKDGDVAFNVKGSTGDFVSTKMNGNTVEISITRATINSDANTGAASVTGNDGLATAKNVADAINKAADAAKAGAAWNLTTNSSTTDKTSVQGGDTVDFINGDNILITQDGTDKKKITVATKKDLTVDSVTAGNTVINTSGLTNGTTAITGSGITTDKVTVGGISIDKTDGINAGGKTIANVASGGTTDTNAANIGDVKQAVANLSQNLNITDGTNNGTVDLKNQKLNVAGANGVTATVNNQTITVGLDADTVNATTKGIGLTADTGSTGNKYLKDGDVSFAVTGDGNLVSTSATAAGVKVAVDAAKVKDLAVDAVTVSKDAQADNPITVTPTAGTNSKDYAIGIDTTKLAAKTDLTYRANNDTDANAKKVSLAKGLNFVNGTLTTASIDTDGVVKYDVNTATITAGADGTVTGPTTDGVATAQNVADAINAAKKASKTEITANTGEAANATTGNVTLTSTTAADGHTIYDVKLNDKVTLGTATNAVTIDGTTGKVTAKNAVIGGVTVDGDNKHVTGLSNTTWNGTATTGRAATEDQLKAVADTAKATTDAVNLKFSGDTNTAAGVVNLKDDTFNIVGDGKYVTTDANGKDLTVKVSEAEVKKSAVAAVTVSTDTTDANNPISVTPTTSADGTTKDYKVTIDGTKIANKTNLSYKANDGTAKQVSLADGLNFKNGTLTTASIDDNGVVKYDVNTAAITTGADGTITGPTTDGVATAKNVADAINAAKKASKTEVTANTGEAANATTGNVSLTSTTAADGHTIYDVKLNDKVTLGTGANAVTIDGTTGAITGKTATIGGVTVNGTANTIGGLSNTTWNGTATTGRAATEDQLKAVADAAGSQTWEITADKKAGTSGVQTGTKENAKVGKDDTVSLIAGENLTVDQASKNFTYSLNKDLVKMNSATFEATGGKTTVIKGDSIVQTDGANVNTTNATSNTITDGTNTSTITAGKAQIGTVGIDGVDSKITTGGTNAVVLNGADGTIKTGAVIVTGGTTNDITGLSNTTVSGADFATKGRAATEEQLKAATEATTLKFTGDVATNTGSVNLKDDTFGIKGDGKYISTDVNGKNVNLIVSEAEVKKSAVAAVTVSTDTTDANNPLTVTPTTSVDGTTKDYKVTIDGTKIANKTNLSYKANAGTAKQVSLADGLNFKNGTLTTASVDDAGVVKYDVNTASITAGTDGTITGPTTDGVATAKNVADAINAAKKASKTEITANTGEAANATTGNVTLTSTTAADGHTIYDVKLNDKVTLGSGTNAVTIDGTAGKTTVGTAVVDGVNNKITTGGANTVTLDGAAGTVTGLTNKDWTPGVTKAVTGRAATEDQLQKVADAASSQTWNITADKAGTTGNQTGTKKNATVGKDETVELVAGDNLTINQDERKFTYSLNKDLANLTSVSVGTGTTETIKLDGATGKITAKNATIGGVTIDGDNKHVTGLSNTTWNGTVTTGRAATEDQLKAVADTAKTTTDAVNLKFSGDTNTSPGVVNLKDDTLGIIGDGKYVSTDANGKNLTVKVSEAEVKKSAVAAVTVSTDTTDANNPLTVTSTTSADGTTKDYKVTIDGTKIANKTNLSYKANDGTAKQVSLADGLNFKNGTLTTASIDDNGVVKYDVNTASITAGADGTITGPTTDGVATAQNVADAINAAKKASKTEITANTGEAASATTGNVTLTSTTAADGHTIYDIKLNDKVTLGSGTNAVTIDGTTGAITGKTATIGGVTVNGTANTIGGLSNTTWNGTATTGRAATEDQLKAVADAAGSQTWKITADKKTGTSGAQTGTKENAKVGKDDKVSLIAGENLTVDQAGKNFTYSLNTDLVKMNSATFLGTGANTTVITGDSITQTAGTQTNTSTADGNTVADGTKSTKTTADGQVIKDGAKSNKSTVDNNVIDDGNGNVNTSNATSNTITDGTNTTATTSSSVTVKDNAGNSTVITKDNVTTGVGANKITLDGTAGKATIGSSIVDGVNNTFTTGGANAVTMNGAAGTVKTGTVTVTGGTTNDITGLSNTTVNSADFATKGRAATEEQLKAATGATTLKFTGDVATNTGSVNLKDDIFGIKGDGKYISTDVNGKNVNLTVSEAEVKKSAVAAVTVSTDTIDANNPLTVTPTTSAGGTTKDYKVTIDGTKIANKTNLSYKANNGTAKQVSLADGLDFTNGTLTTASIDDKGVVKYDVNTASITAGTDGTITGPTTDGVATAKNVADAINAAKKASKTEITANTGEAANATTGNVSLTSTTAADGHTIYDVKLNDKVTLGTGANAVTIDGTAGKATIGSSIVDGVNNTFTTGGASPVTLNGATGTITGKTANIGGVTVDGTNNHVMGLANKDWTPGVTQAVSGRAATEDQLQKVSDAVGAGWKVNTGKITGSTGESNGAASTKVASGEEVQFQAGNNLIVDQNGKTVAYSLNKALKDLESATFNGTGTNKTVITGDSITQTAGTQTNTSTAGGNTIADGTKSTKTTADGQVIKDGTKTNTSTVDENTIIDGTKSNKSTVDGNTITDGTNTTATTSSSVTVKDNAGNSTIITKDNITTGVGGNKITLDGTAGKATIGSSIVDGVNNTFTTGGTNAVALDGGAGTVKTGTVTVTGGTTNDITGLSNTTVTATDFATKGRAATEEQLKAVGEQTWQITADKDATTSGAQTGTKKDAKVGKDNKVQLIAGENMTVNQNERDFTFTLNKDLVKMNSATFLGTGTNTTVITGDSITQTAGTQTNTSTAAGNTVANGANSTATTAAGTTVTTANGNTNYAADGVRINTTGKTPVSLTDAGLDNGNNVIKNVASGHVNNDATDNTNAANIADVKKATTTVTANAGEVANATTGNVTLTSTAAADGHTIYDVKLNDKVTLGTGANAVMIDGTAGKATVGTAVVDGVNNIITTGGASPVTLNGATGTIIGKTANIGGVTVDGTNNHVMGLANKDWTPGVTQAVSGRAATENQLQKVSDAVGAGWKVNTGKVTGSTGEFNGAASTKVASGEEVQFQAGNNLIVDQNGKTVAYSLNKALKDLESATFNGAGTNKTVITGDSITQTAGTQTNTSTAAGNTVADGTKSTKTTADGQVIKDGTKTNTSTVDENTIVDGAKSNKTTVDSNVINDGNGNVNTSNATSNTITDGTNTVATTSSSVTVKDNAGNSTVITKDNITTGVGANKIILDGAAGTIKTGTVTVTGGTTNDITGLSNTTVTATDFATKGRAATEEQLKAVGEQTWQITADKKTGTSGAQTGLKENAKVGKDDKVSLIAGENLTVDQAGKNFTYSLNSDLVKMNSATFLGTGTNTTVITGDSITQTAGSQTNTSTAGGNTVADGTKSTEITAAGQVIKDGAKSNKSTVDKNVIDDGTGNVNTSNATSNTITDGTNTSTIAAGKATIGSSIIDGVNNTFTTGGASPVTLNGATGTITGKTANIGGVTVDGTNNHVMGLANKDWTPGVTQAVSGRAATEDQLQKVSDAVGAGWKVNTGKVTGSTGESNGATSTKVSSGEEVQFQAGNNLIVDQNGKTVAYSLNKALKDLESATFNGTGTNKTVITGDSITQTSGTQTNTSTAGGNTVADGTKSTETTAAGQVIKDGTKSNKSTVDNNVIDDGTGNINTSNATSNTVTDGTNTTEATASTLTVKDNAGNSTVITKDNITTGVGGNKITLDGTAGKATIGSSVVDGVNNTFTTGGTNAVTMNGAAGTIKTGAVTVTGGTTNDITGLSNTTVNSADFAMKGRAATEEQLKAVGEQTWQITADKDATTSGAQTGTKKDAKVGKDNKVQLIAGENMTVNQNERDFTFTLNKDLVKMNSATFLGTGSNTTVITGNSITQTAGTQTNTSTAGGNNITDGTKSTETTAAGQVIKDGTKTNTSTVDENTIVDGTKSNKSTVDGNTITDGTNTTETTSSSVTVKDNAGNSTVITKDNITTGVGGNKITLDGTAGKATIGSSIIDGVNNTFTTGGTNAVTLDGAAGTIKTSNVTVTGGTTNDITGLSNTTVTSADFATKGRAATEEQLKAVGEQTWQITADKDATTSGAQTGTKKDAKVGKDNKVQLIAGENMTVNQNERDFTFTLNKDLVKMNSATFLGTGSNTTVITGNSITQTAGTQTNTSTAGGNTITDGTKSTETTAAGQVIKDGAKTNKSTVDSNVIDDGNGNKNISNATSNTITDGTNTSTITAGKANIGNIAVDGVNNKITMGTGATPVTLDGANGHLDGLTNTTWVPGVTKATTGRAATEDQLQQVSDAVGAGWKVNTGTVAGSSGVSNGAASTKVSSGEEVKLQAGDNLVIDQNGKTVSYSLNKDLTKMNSATFEATGGKTTVIKGDSIVQTDGSKTNTSNAAGNTVVDGNKSTATTAAGTTITDGAKTNTSTADKNVINDGSGNTNTATATSNTLKNAAGDETKVDANGATVKDAAGNNATFTKDGITITNTSKDTVSLTSNGLDNGKNKIINVADGTNPTDAVNVRQLDAKTKAATTELTANDGQPANSTNGNIMIAKSIDTKDGHTIYDTKLNDKITLGAADPTKAITVDGTTGTVTGLTNKTWTPGSIVSGRAATEDQLKDAVADSGWKVAVGKDGSGKSNVVGTSPEKIKAEETVTFKAGNNMMVTQTGKSISYAVNPELTNMTSATFTDTATGNTTVMNSNGITITPSGANPTNPYAGPVSLTKDGLNNGNNQIKGVAPGTDPTDAVNVAQLNASNANTSQAINQLAGEVQHVGAHAAAMAALKPIQYDPLEPTQVMAGVGNYRGETAAALGLAHYTNENTMFNVGVSVGGNHNMVNAGVTHKFGYSPEKKNIPDRYKAGPISSVYVMQDEVSSLKKENAEQKYVIADQAARLTTLEAENEQQRRELAETKKGLDDLKAAVDKLLASKG